MSDLPPTDRLELASAYLDDALPPPERALVEADRELMAMVTELRSVKGRVAEVAPPPPWARDGAMAAAMAAFDELHGATGGAAPEPTTGWPPATEVPPAPVLSLDHARERRTRRMWRLLPVGGAVAAALLVGAVVVSQRGGDDSSEQLADAPAATESAKVGDDMTMEATGETGFMTEDVTGEAAEADGIAAAEMAPSEMATEAAEEAAPAEGDSPLATEAPAQTEAPAETVAPEVPAETTVALTPVQQLVDLGVRDEPPALSELDAIEPPVDVPLCDGKAIARIVYRGTEALVLRRASGAVAIVVVDCTSLAEIAV